MRSSNITNFARGEGKRPPCREIMQVFDALPPTVREAVRNAYSDWDLHWLLARVREGVDPDALADVLVREDVKRVAAANIERGL